MISWAVLPQPVFSQEEKGIVNHVSVDELSREETDDLDEGDEALAEENTETVAKDRKDNHKKKKKGKSKILIPPNEDDIILELD